MSLHYSRAWSGVGMDHLTGLLLDFTCRPHPRASAVPTTHTTMTSTLHTSMEDSRPWKPADAVAAETVVREAVEDLVALPPEDGKL